jgi:hypothetical protein
MPFRVDDPSFSGGEIAPATAARIDTAKYRTALKQERNCIGQVAGGVTKRQGFEFVGEVRDSSHLVRLIPFQFTLGQAYAIEFGNMTARFATRGGYLLETSLTIQNITNSNPAVVTCDAHGYTTGNSVYFSGIQGMQNMNGRTLFVTVIDANTFSVPVDTTNFGVFSGDTGGIAGNANGGVGGQPADPVAPTVPPPYDPTNGAGNGDTTGTPGKGNIGGTVGHGQQQ